MADDERSADEIIFDENTPEHYTSDAQDHFFRAMTHHAGHGPHPGQYSPLKSVIEEAGASAEPEPKKPLPPQEALGPQPPIGGKGGKDGGGKPPSQGTPAGIGAQAAQSPPPSGDF